MNIPNKMREGFDCKKANFLLWILQSFPQHQQPVPEQEVLQALLNKKGILLSKEHPSLCNHLTFFYCRVLVNNFKNKIAVTVNTLVDFFLYCRVLGSE